MRAFADQPDYIPFFTVNSTWHDIILCESFIISDE